MKKYIAPTVAIICTFLLWNQLFPLSLFNTKNKLAFANPQNDYFKKLEKKLVNKDTALKEIKPIEESYLDKTNESVTDLNSKKEKALIQNKSLNKHTRARLKRKSARETFTIYFDKNESTVKKSEESKLDLLITKIKKENIRNIQINGHSDSRESDISLQRAKTISNALKSIFTNSEMKINSFGKKYLADKSSSFLAHANNRRVVIGLN